MKRFYRAKSVGYMYYEFNKPRYYCYTNRSWHENPEGFTPESMFDIYAATELAALLLGLEIPQ